MTVSSKVVEFDELVKSLNKIIFGSEIETVTLNGITKPTISNFLKSYTISKADLSYVDTNIANINTALAAISGGHKAYQTLAAAQAAQSSLPANTIVEITNDSTASNNGMYQWDGTTLTKSNYDPLAQAKTWATAEFSNDILRPLRLQSGGVTGQRLNKAIKSLSLRGDWLGKLITLSNMSYVNGVFTIQLARPDSLNEVMGATSNTKFVARFTGPITFSGIQTLQLPSYGNTSAGISGEVVIDFNELLTTDLLAADYIASNRMFDNRAIIDLNATYTKIKSIDTAISDVNTSIDTNKSSINKLNLVYGTDFKNAKINDAIERVVFFKPLPKDKYIILKSLYYFTAPQFACELYIADTPTDQGTLWARGVGTIDADNKVVILFDQGYMTVNLNYYYAANGVNGAAVIQDNATFLTRGLNQALVEQAVLDPKIFTRYENQYVPSATFHLPTDLWQRSLKLYINGPIADTDYFLPATLFWNIVNGKYRLNFQIKKMSTVTQAVTDGLIIYAGNVEFDSLDKIKGSVTTKLNPINGFKLEALLELNFDNLKFRDVDYNNTYTPYFLNRSDFTYEKYGFDVVKLRKTSRDKFCTTSGIVKYPSLKYALDVKERNLFSVGGNMFKSTVEVPLTKDDLLCVNNPPKILAKKPRKREYDFYYKLNGVTSKIRLNHIDSEDTFYFVNGDVIVKSPHPLKQTLTPVASASAADFVVFDVSKNAYFSISNFTKLFTKTDLSVTTINFVQLTYDDELFIVAGSPNRTILITENNQTSLRSFNFSGTSGTKYIFGDGVTLIKDWCFSHHKNVMFVCDYDSGVNGIRGTTGGQKCYVSTDNGYTFTKCFDFTGTDWSRVINALAITNHDRASAHIHAVTYDPKQNVVWIVTGDGAVYLDNTSFFYSRDLGQTWVQMRSTMIDNNIKGQMIKALPFDGCVAFGSDDGSVNGTAVITYDGDRMVYELAKDFIGKGKLLAYARGFWSSNFSNIKYISFGKDVQQISDPDAKSFVIASSNGYKWEMVWEDYSASIHSSVYCYDDTSGKVFISLDGSGDSNMRVVALDLKYV